MDEHKPGRSHAGRHVEQIADLYEDEISLQPLFRSIWLYRRVIGGVVAGVMACFVVAALAAFVFLPVERLGMLEFRLLFVGADRGEYPNGMPFSSAEITATPVLTEVFETNELERYGSYKNFGDSIFILRSDPELELLSYEYQARLADSRLTPVDRARIEDEFRSKREGLTDPRFSLTLREDRRVTQMPPSLVSKVLDDTLATWARQADERKGALQYDISIYSKNILRRNVIETEDYLTAIDILRTQVQRVLTTVDEIAALPGAAVIRTGEDRVSLAEIRAGLDDVLRFELQPLIDMIRTTGLSTDPQALDLYVTDQLFQIGLQREEAQNNVNAVRNSLRDYMFQKGAVVVPSAGLGSEGAMPGVALGGSTPTMIPQFSESFLDRLVELSTLNSDSEYRQELTNRIIEESVAIAALEREQAYYESLSYSVNNIGSSSRGGDLEDLSSTILATFSEVFDDVMVAVERLNAIYEELSILNLNPATLLYTVTTPFTMRTERALSLRTVALYGMLVFMLSLFVVPLGCLIHSYFQREITHPETGARPAGRARGVGSEEQREEERAAPGAPV